MLSSISSNEYVSNGATSVSNHMQSIFHFICVKICVKPQRFFSVNAYTPHPFSTSLSLSPRVTNDGNSFIPFKTPLSRLRIQNPSGVWIKNTNTSSSRLAFFTGKTGNSFCVPFLFAKHISASGQCLQSGETGLQTSAPSSNRLCVNCDSLPFG